MAEDSDVKPGVTEHSSHVIRATVNDGECAIRKGCLVMHSMTSQVRMKAHEARSVYQTLFVSNFSGANGSVYSIPRFELQGRNHAELAADAPIAPVYAPSTSGPCPSSYRPTHRHHGEQATKRQACNVKHAAGPTLPWFCIRLEVLSNVPAAPNMAVKRPETGVHECTHPSEAGLRTERNEGFPGNGHRIVVCCSDSD